MNTDRVAVIRRKLLAWYNKYQRHHLPWRATRDPYHILVSEVMLQQTQVDRVIVKYHSFLRRFPTVHKLARAKASSVITEWKGLGYNRRALFLQRTAQTVVKDFGGVFPQDLATLKLLPGVGDYTARAILAFAFEQKVPMMDTNHRRFYQRVYVGMKEKKDKELLLVAEKVFSTRKAYDWNQALMDFGSLVCTTRKPKCEECPLRKECRAYPGITRHVARIKKHKKPQVSFRDSDRYFRGRIVDGLREERRVSLMKLRGRFVELDDERFTRIVEKLVKDGLVKKQGKSLVLP